jgi:hypothetical protein
MGGLLDNAGKSEAPHAGASYMHLEANYKARLKIARLSHPTLAAHG